MDYRSYVKPYENYIVKDKDGKYEVNGSPYKQIDLTEYNPDMEIVSMIRRYLKVD